MGMGPSRQEISNNILVALADTTYRSTGTTIMVKKQQRDRCALRKRDSSA
jgi:hypothetical protein